MRRRRRVTGRFYIFIAAILIMVFLIVRPYLSFGSNEDVIFTWNSSYEQKMDCVIIRDEAVTLSDSTVRVEYIAAENT